MTKYEMDFLPSREVEKNNIIALVNSSNNEDMAMTHKPKQENKNDK